MALIKVRLVDPLGASHRVRLPDDVAVGEMLEAIRRKLRLPSTDARGALRIVVRSDRDGRDLAQERSLRQARVVEDAVLLLRLEPTRRVPTLRTTNLAVETGSGARRDARARAAVERPRRAEATPPVPPKRRLASPTVVFLSAKQLGDDGRRARDSVLAELVYERLVAEGLATFFAPRSLETAGRAQYVQAIDEALDEAKVLVAVGTKREHLDSGWVRSEWEGFVNDLRAGTKPEGRVFCYLEGMSERLLPRSLRPFQSFTHSDESLTRLVNFIRQGL